MLESQALNYQHLTGQEGGLAPACDKAKYESKAWAHPPSLYGIQAAEGRFHLALQGFR
jgi:hypothetical protein